MQLNEQIDDTLANLRQAIRRYVLWRGLAIVFSVAVGLFWLLLAFDFLWFGVTRLEVPRPLRLTLLVLSLCVLVFTLYQSLIWQLLVKLRRRALALLMERTFPDLDNRLITVVEYGEQNGRESRKTTSLSETMMQRTLHETEQRIKVLDLSRVFDYQPLRTAVTIATFAMITFVATAAARPDTFRHWSQAYVSLSDEYWNRRNGLDIVVLAQPGERIRQFENRQLKHPAGADLTVVARTLEDKLPPETATISYRTSTGARGRALMTPLGEGEFRYTIGDLVDDLRFTITGGDYTTIEPYQVVTVPEPTLEAMAAECTYPDYTDWNRADVGMETSRVVDASEFAVPMETKVLLRASASRPLRSIRVSGRTFEFEITHPQGESPTGICRYLDDRGLTTRQVRIVSEQAPLLSEDQRKVTLPLLVTQQSAPSEAEVAPWVRIPQTDDLRIVLEDEFEIRSLEPLRLSIRGIPDESPSVNSRLIGIGNAITRKAFIPIEGDLEDDYGLASLQFEYRVDQNEKATKPLQQQPQGMLQYQLPDATSTERERFDVLPMNLEVGNVLYLNLLAEDNDDINGPHTTRSETYRMKIVTDEELLSILHQDELNLRRRFEQLIDELTRARDNFADVAQPSEQEEAASEEEVLANSTQRCLNVLRKDTVEADAIRAAFDEIQLELINNRVDTPQMRNRIQNKIIDPLAKLLENEFTLTEEHLRMLEFYYRDGTPTVVTAESCLGDLDQLLSGLRQILLEMRKLESFQEVIELLKGIIDDQQELKEKTEAERKKKLIDLLN